MGRPVKEYDVYDRAGNYVCGGTAEQMREYFGFSSTNRIHKLCCLTRKGINTKWKVYEYKEEAT